MLIGKSYLQTQRTELKETIVEQQIKISKFERQGFGGLSRPPKFAIPVETIDTRKPDIIEDRNSTGLLTGLKVALRSKDEYLSDSAPSTPGTMTIPLTPHVPIPVPFPDGVLNTPTRQSQVQLSPALTPTEPPIPLSIEIAPDQKEENQQDGVPEVSIPTFPSRRGKKRGGSVQSARSGCLAPVTQKNTGFEWF